MHEMVGEELSACHAPTHTIHNNLKGRYCHSHFIVKLRLNKLARVLIQYIHRHLQRQKTHSSSSSSSDSQCFFLS